MAAHKFLRCVYMQYGQVVIKLYLLQFEEQTSLKQDLSLRGIARVVYSVEAEIMLSSFILESNGEQYGIELISFTPHSKVLS